MAGSENPNCPNVTSPYIFLLALGMEDWELGLAMKLLLVYSTQSTSSLGTITGPAQHNSYSCCVSCHDPSFCPLGRILT